MELSKRAEPSIGTKLRWTDCDENGVGVLTGFDLISYADLPEPYFSTTPEYTLQYIRSILEIEDVVYKKIINIASDYAIDSGSIYNALKELGVSEYCVASKLVWTLHPERVTGELKIIPPGYLKSVGNKQIRYYIYDDGSVLARFGSTGTIKLLRVNDDGDWYYGSTKGFIYNFRTWKKDV